ncbi:hypothetical protein CABS02_13782 [Colletotrichum abscissum]|uniref:Uncharacterized protein n=1 Tax=Colletotrichum abscissum TaxID=1671311 RepID=A0A9P9X2L4_9PEZI|nr:hypothetical protein CABS02_13782 [Colletotrichum abscissum]
MTIPSEIVDPAKSVASKAGEHIATAVASAKQAVSTALADVWQNLRSKFFDDLTRWEDTVPVYFCLQTRGVWQLGYPNSTSKIVSSKDFDVKTSKSRNSTACSAWHARLSPGCRTA